jgi:hypothetical protein
MRMECEKGPHGPESASTPLCAAEIASFIRDGFIRLDHAFSRQTAEQARAILWQATECDPYDRSTWTRPVIRLDKLGQAPFREAAKRFLAQPPLLPREPICLDRASGAYSPVEQAILNAIQKSDG